MVFELVTSRLRGSSDALRRGFRCSYWNVSSLRKGRSREVGLCASLFLGAFAKLWKATASFVMYFLLYMYVCLSVSAWNNSAATGRIFVKSDMWWFFDTVPSRKFNFDSNLTRITSTLHEDVFLYTFMIVSRWVLVIMRKISGRSCSEKQNTFYGH